MSTFGARLKYARELAGLDRQTLTKLAGLKSPAHVGMIERNPGADPAGSTAVKHATALGVSAAWLISGDGRVPSRRTIREAVTAAQMKGAA
jgi:transcriptional regulator with XRE-family HTH domain